MASREGSLCPPDASGVSVHSCVETRLKFSGVQFRYLWRFGCITLQLARLEKGEMAPGVAHSL